MMTDPIADMLTRIRNALRIRRDEVRMPKSSVKRGIAEVLKREGYVKSVREEGDGIEASLIIDLKYGPDGEDVISVLRRESRPGRRLYSKVDELRPVLSGLGITIISTSQGILSDRECRKKRVGGEVLCTVY